MLFLFLSGATALVPQMEHLSANFSVKLLPMDTLSSRKAPLVAVAALQSIR